MNLTKLFEEICDELETQGAFNGVEVIEAHCTTEEQKRKDARLDELSEQEEEDYVNNYACVCFNFDFYSGNWHDFDAPEYVTTEFNREGFESDFIEYLLEKGVPEDCIPSRMYLDGGDTEFYKGVK